MDIFIELSIIIGIATLVSCVMRLLKQPFVVGYILTGVIVGPYYLNIAHSTESIELFSTIGIAILLFIVGLSLNPIVIREVGKVALVTGLGQVAFTSIAGFFLIRWLGYSVVESSYAAIALTFSSTIIILKLLSDRGDLNKLYGKIAIGFLLVQDLVATIILLIVSSVASSGGQSVGPLLVALMIKGLIAITLLFLGSRYILPKLSSFFASSQELLFLFSISWGLSMATLFYMLGFSVEVGALIAGVSLSISPFAYEIGSRMKPLRDFFIVLFFILLGSQMVIADIGSLVMPALILSIFVLVGNPLIVFFLMNVLGFRRKTGFMAGLTVAQISEFSLILAALGFSVGHLSQSVVSLITLVGVITIAGSTYLILYADQIYKKIEWLLKYLEIRKNTRREKNIQGKTYDAIIFGYDRVGSDFIHAVKKLGGSYLVVDFNPQSIKRLQNEDIPFKYGDAEDVEFLSELELDSVKLVISTIPDFNANMLLVKTYRTANPSGVILVLSHDIEQAKELYLSGATYVVMPHHLGAHYASQLISKHGFDVAEFERERNIHLTRLAKRDR